MLSLFSTFENVSNLTLSPQAKRAETDPGQGTPTRANFQPPEGRAGQGPARGERGAVRVLFVLFVSLFLRNNTATTTTTTAAAAAATTTTTNTTNNHYIALLHC